jgi:hypothetical protein
MVMDRFGEVCWKDEILKAMAQNDDKFVSWTLTDEEAEEKFYNGYGNNEGCEFTAWGEKYVYFPVVYDGSEWVGWAPRNPCNEKTFHAGGQ